MSNDPKTMTHKVREVPAPAKFKERVTEEEPVATHEPSPEPASVINYEDTGNE